MARPSIGMYRDIREYMSAPKTMKVPTRPARSHPSSSDSADDQDPLSADGPLRGGEFGFGDVSHRKIVERRVGPRLVFDKGSLGKSVVADKDVVSDGDAVANKGVKDKGMADRAVVDRRATTESKLSRSRIAVVLSATPRKAFSCITESATPSRHRAYRSDGASLPVRTASIPGSQVQRRGRPKGWKPGMSYSEMLGSHGRTRPSRAKAPPPGFGKRRGRAPRAPSPPPNEIYRRLQAQFADFICEWAGCKAELHNLETLRKHFYAVHIYDAVHGRDGQDEVTCRWGKCASAEPAWRFASDEEFGRHVDEKHLDTVAWHVGDGPQNRVHDVRELQAKAYAIPDFLLDASGNQVTPSVCGQEVEDVATWRMNRRRLKDLRTLRDAMLPDDDDDESGTGSEMEEAV